ncbi:MAG: hypothetical protein ACXAC6_07200 [Candidatus Hodarchaeales archaeon]
MKRISLVMLVIVVASASSLSSANTNTIVWSDNFDDGNLDGWEIIGHEWITPASYDLWTGNASAANNELWINGSGDFQTTAGYPSSITHGTWTFDVIAKNFVWVSFASNNYVTNYSTSIGSDYTLVISYDSLQLWKRVDGVGTTLYSKAISGIAGHWQHVNITKDMSNRILVSINGTLRVNVTDDSLATSLHFKLITKEVAGLDNVTVSDFTSPTTTETTVADTTTTTTAKSSPSWTPTLVLLSLTALPIFRKRMKHH